MAKSMEALGNRLARSLEIPRRELEDWLREWNSVQTKDIASIEIAPVKKYDQETFNYDNLVLEFKKAVPDYGNALLHGVGNLSLDWANKVIFEIMPAIRKRRDKDCDAYYKTICEDKITRKISTVIIATYKHRAAPKEQPVFDGHCITLTMKQASLLAVNEIALLQNYSSSTKADVQKKPVLFTPLAGALFCKTDMPELYEELRTKEPNTTFEDMINSINMSCQSGGHHLKGSRVDIALLSVIAGTVNMRDRNERKNRILTVVKQYRNKGKYLDEEAFNMFQKYQNGGLPIAIQIRELIEMFDKCRAEARKKEEAVEEKVAAQVADIY